MPFSILESGLIVIIIAFKGSFEIIYLYTLGLLGIALGFFDFSDKARLLHGEVPPVLKLYNYHAPIVELQSKQTAPILSIKEVNKPPYT